MKTAIGSRSPVIKHQDEHFRHLGALKLDVTSEVCMWLTVNADWLITCDWLCQQTLTNEDILDNRPFWSWESPKFTKWSRGFMTSRCDWAYKLNRKVFCFLLFWLRGFSKIISTKLYKQRSPSLTSNPHSHFVLEADLKCHRNSSVQERE